MTNFVRGFFKLFKPWFVCANFGLAFGISSAVITWSVVNVVPAGSEARNFFSGLASYSLFVGSKTPVEITNATPRPATIVDIAGGDDKNSTLRRVLARIGECKTLPMAVVTENLQKNEYDDEALKSQLASFSNKHLLWVGTETDPFFIGGRMLPAGVDVTATTPFPEIDLHTVTRFGHAAELVALGMSGKADTGQNSFARLPALAKDPQIQTISAREITNSENTESICSQLTKNRVLVIGSRDERVTVQVGEDTRTIPRPDLIVEFGAAMAGLDKVSMPDFQPLVPLFLVPICVGLVVGFWGVRFGFAAALLMVPPVVLGVAQQGSYFAIETLAVALFFTLMFGAVTRQLVTWSAAGEPEKTDPETAKTE